MGVSSEGDRVGHLRSKNFNGAVFSRKERELSGLEEDQWRKGSLAQGKRDVKKYASST